jgi:hypothetical protein
VCEVEVEVKGVPEEEEEVKVSDAGDKGLWF